MEKDFPHYIFKSTSISIVRGDSQGGRGTTRGVQGRDGGTHSGGHEVAQFGGKRG